MYIGSQTFMKRYDQCLLDHGYSILELVDKASECCLKHMHYHSYAIVCGPGNNGADGLGLAIKLSQQGKAVHVYICEEENVSEANRYYLDQCYVEDMNVVILNEGELEQAIEIMKTKDVIIDAIFGFGLKRSPRGIYQSVIEEINQLYEQEIIAIDIPTGLDCNHGNPYQSVICATQTITLIAFKNGFLNPDSLSFTGQVILETLDVDDVFEDVGFYQYVGKKEIAPFLKERGFDGHKGTYGRVGMITGSSQYKGASLLSTKSAVYSGTGVATAITTPEVIASLTIFCPEATTVVRPPIFRQEDFQRYDALLIGCGLGLDIDAYRYVQDVLSLSSQPLVIDADALTILASQTDILKNQNRPIILTPHMGEFKRLCEVNEESDVLYVAKEFAKEKEVILVLKGPYTIVTDGVDAYRVHAGNPAMATGGMGDVLAGIITSLLGQGYQAIEAALLGVYLHGYTGDCLAEEAYTVIPSQLIERLPLSMKEIMKKK